MDKVEEDPLRLFVARNSYRDATKKAALEGQPDVTIVAYARRMAEAWERTPESLKALFPFRKA